MKAIGSALPFLSPAAAAVKLTKKKGAGTGGKVAPTTVDPANMGRIGLG